MPRSRKARGSFIVFGEPSDFLTNESNDQSMPQQASTAGFLPHGITRRGFLTATAAGGVAFLAGGAAALLQAKAPFRGPDEDVPWFEATILELQALMSS